MKRAILIICLFISLGCVSPNPQADLVSWDEVLPNGETVSRYVSTTPIVKSKKGFGSGIAINGKDNAYILTAHHVVNDGDELVYRFLPVNDSDNVFSRHDFLTKSYKTAVKVAYDEDYDLALLMVVDGDFRFKESATFSNKESLTINELIYCVGTPESYLNYGTIVRGFITYNNPKKNMVVDIRARRIIMQRGLESSAIIRGGFSGGGVYDTNGDCIGVIYGYSTMLNSYKHCLATPIQNIREFLNSCGYGDLLRNEVVDTGLEPVTPAT